ncbi:MAG TPA: AlkA N-terminal domain-containing protein [Geobacteraceae bacterium]
MAEKILLDHGACYDAMRAHDVRFDGRIFCGVSSTGIYCRPVCRVKLPKEENCTFFPSAPAAEAAGFRPCLRCRPELAPGLSAVDASTRLARIAARLMEEDCLTDRTITDLAEKLGISDRHLRRIFFAEYGVTPVHYLQTQRLLLAKSLLTDTLLAVTDVAMTAGFGSIRRFNDLFRKRYRLAPSRFRDRGTGAGSDEDAITLTLAYRPPYAWDQILAFLAERAVPGVEEVAGTVYRRTAAIRRGETIHRGWLAVARRPGQDALAITMATTLLPVLPQVLARVRHLFDLNCDPAVVFEKLASMEAIAPNIRVPGIRLPGCFDSFEMATRAVLGQQITVRAARTLAGRLAASLGERIETPFPALFYTFPLPERISALTPPVEERLGPLGITGARCRSILALANALARGSLTLSPGTEPDAAMAKLVKLPGFGPWTAQYVGMRVLGWPDAFLASDYGVKKALSSITARERADLVQSWRPWGAYATVTLWNYLAGTERVKE